MISSRVCNAGVCGTLGEDEGDDTNDGGEDGSNTTFFRMTRVDLGGMWSFFKNPYDRLYARLVESLATRLVSNERRASSTDGKDVVSFVNVSVSKGSMPLETMLCDSK